jgi:hypothetical protein
MSAFLINWQKKYLAAGVLSEAPDPLLPPFNTVMVTYLCTYSHREGGGGRWTSEKVRGSLVHKRGSKIPTWLTVSPVYKLYYSPVKTTFRVWCLYRYLVHGSTSLEDEVTWSVLGLEFLNNLWGLGTE